MKIFLQSFTQVALIVINILLLDNRMFVGMYWCTCWLSLFLVFTHDEIDLTTLKEKLISALGAGCGAITGILIIQKLIQS